MKKQVPFNIIQNINDLKSLALSSGSDNQAAMNFYKSGARGKLFNLEAVMRILKFSMDKRKFKTGYRLFKEAEGILGAVDFHEALFNEMVLQKDAVPDKFIEFFKRNMDDEYSGMQKLLTDQKWIGKDLSLYDNLISGFREINYPDENKLRKDLADYFIKQLKKCQKVYLEEKININDIENGVHEIRRKLRWVSMYAQVTSGWIQLKENKNIAGDLLKYHTKEIVESKFNVLPQVPANFKPVYIAKENFYALSWIIEALGKLKDQGEKVLEINNAIKDCKIKSSKELDLIREKYNASLASLAEVPIAAKKILDDFFVKDKIAERIIDDLRESI